MYLPTLTEMTKSRDQQIEFKGYNHNLYVGENQFYDTGNLCATHYPVMCPRAARATVRTLTNAQALFARGKLCYVAGGQFYYDGTSYGSVTSGEKQLVGMGAYILIFPDGKRFHTGTKVMDSLGAGYTATGSVRMSLCRLDGSDYNNVTTAATAPEEPANGAYWLDTSGDVHVLKVYSNGAWVSVPTTYVRIASTGIGTSFKSGDAVTISGSAESSLNADHSIIDHGDDYLVVIGVIDQVKTQTGGLKVERRIPEMDFVCEYNNRIWGCSNAKHEIYACKLGDPTNWYDYSGLASDSYAATVGSDGDFTGCVAFGGAVLFFKEEMLHKVLGTKPANFQINDSPLRGVQAGCAHSLCVVNESLMYKSRDCVCVYDGGTPMDVSDALGHDDYFDAAAGARGDLYYISMRDTAGAWQMFVFDEAKGLWFREDNTHARQFAALNGQLYYLDDAGRVMAVRGSIESGAVSEGAVRWYAETGDLLTTLPDNKYVSRVQLRIGVDKGSELKLEAQYDSDGIWHKILEKKYTRKASFTAPIIPRRCDHLRLRISGVGRSCVYAISKEIERGSEL